jgi:hypothetical protein
VLLSRVLEERLVISDQTYQDFQDPVTRDWTTVVSFYLAASAREHFRGQTAVLQSAGSLVLSHLFDGAVYGRLIVNEANSPDSLGDEVGRRNASFGTSLDGDVVSMALQLSTELEVGKNYAVRLQAQGVSPDGSGETTLEPWTADCLLGNTLDLTFFGPVKV